MIHTDENAPLLENDSKRKKTDSSIIRFFVNLGIILIFFKGSEAMVGSCYKQYLYFWSQQYLNNNNTDAAGSNNASNTTSPNLSNSGTQDCDKNNGAKSSDDKAQTLASQWQMYLDIGSAVLGFVSVSLYGTISDYVGRKVFGCLALFGYATKGAIFAAVIYFDLHIAYFFIAIVFDALCGSSYTFSLFSYSSSADVTNDVRARVIAVAVIETLFGFGSLSTEVANGYVIKHFGYFYSMLIAACGIYFSWILAIILLKETKKFDEHRSVQTKEANHKTLPSCRILFNNYIGFYFSSDQKGKKIFWVCLIIFFLVELHLLNKSSLMTLYELGRPFCWNSEQIGWYEGIYIATVYVMGTLLLKPILHCLSEMTAACLGIVSAIAYNLVVGLASSTLDLYLSIIAGVFMVLPKSIIRGMVSSRVTGQKQGAVFASLQSSEMLCKLVASFISLNIYSHTLDTMRGFAFLLFAGVSLFTLILTIWVRRLFQLERRKETITITVESPPEPET